MNLDREQKNDNMVRSIAQRIAVLMTASTNLYHWFKPPKNHLEQSRVMARTINVLQSAFFNPGKLLKSLQHRTSRKVRSERRHAMLLLMQTMLYYCDHESLRVGRRITNKWKNISLYRLAHYAGLTLSRAKRAFRDLIKKGYIITRKESKNCYEPTLKEITLKFFQELGMLQDIQRLKNFRNERRIAKEKKEEKKHAKGMSSIVKQLISLPKSLIKKTPLAAPQHPVVSVLSRDEMKALLIESEKLHQQDPLNSRLYYFDILKKELLRRKGI